MKKKLFSFILSFTVIAVTATAINCGCAFAEMPSAQKKVERSAMAHCEQHEEASKEAEECCLGCQLQLGALNPHNIDFQLQRSGELIPSNLFYNKSFLEILSTHPVILSHLQGFDAHGVPFYNAPIYLAVQSFLI